MTAFRARVTYRRHSDERGLAAPVVVTLAALLTVLAFVCVAGGRLLVDHRRATAAADLAALAGATAVQHGEDGCPAVDRFARLNGTRLESCAVHGEVVDVRVSVRSALLLGRTVVLTADARAGPADP